MDPDQGIDDEAKATHDKVYTWQMLRSIAENDLSKFIRQDKNYDIEQLALEYVSQHSANFV